MLLIIIYLNLGDCVHPNGQLFGSNNSLYGFLVQNYIFTIQKVMFSELSKLF